MLEEVEMPPGELGEVVSLAGLAARWARKQGATLGGDLEMQLVGLGGGVEPLADQPPRRRHAEAQRQYVVGVHGLPPFLTAARVPPCSGRSSTLLRRCRGGQGAILDRPCARRCSEWQVRTKGWPPGRTKGRNY